jgi:catechol 2,3-dioxygenase-like lactoylglutathione lyase family enzyme
MTEAVPRFDLVVLDCPNPTALAGFYARLLDWPLDDEANDDSDWVTLRAARGGAGIAFQRIPDYRPPTWPAGERPQMFHLDLNVADPVAAHDRALALGATVLDEKHAGRFVVYADLDGHPFCLCVVN